MLRCKFKLDGVQDCSLGDEPQRQVNLSAVTDDGGESNRSWSQWTPSGALEIVVTNPAAIEKIDEMQEGDLYYIDIVRAE